MYKDPLVDDTNLYLHYGDLADAVQLVKLLYDLQPDEIYNLGAQSHVRVSFDIPEYTGDVTGVGAVRILEAIREAGLVEKVRYYQASSSEMYGKVQGGSSGGNDTILASFSLCLRESIRSLVNGELS